MWQTVRERREGEPNDPIVSMIPVWSMVLAAVFFVAAQYFFFRVLPPPRPGILPMRMLISYSWGTAFASYLLLIGYISRDVRRRAMSAGMWMLLVLVMPGGIGAVVYFLMRQPLLQRCPSCSTEVAANFHFCPQCQFQMSPVCGRCYRGTQITDVYCVNCGNDLANDSTPERLRLYSD